MQCENVECHMEDRKVFFWTCEGMGWGEDELMEFQTMNRFDLLENKVKIVPMLYFLSENMSSGH